MKSTQDISKEHSNQISQLRAVESDPSNSTRRKRNQADDRLENRKLFRTTMCASIERSNQATSFGNTSQSPIIDSFTVPFWKRLNHSKKSNELHVKLQNYFSVSVGDEGKEIFDDHRYLRVYKYPLQDQNVHLDLNRNEPCYASEDDEKSIKPLLNWLCKHKDRFFHGNRFTFDFLSWRGVLRAIMFSAFEKFNDWTIAVVKFKNAYFICEFLTEAQSEKNRNQTAQEQIFCGYGYAFEDLVTEFVESIQTTHIKKQICGVFQSQLGSHRLFYGGEIDCINDAHSEHPENLELKVTKGDSSDQMDFRFNRKFGKWWLQSYLAGIKKIVLGLRDDNGIVKHLRPIELTNIEHDAETWTGQSFFNFFDEFADFIKKNVVDEYSSENKSVVLFRHLIKESRIVAEKSSDPKYHFVPDSFYHEFS